MNKLSVTVSFLALAFALTAFASGPAADADSIRAETSPSADLVAPAAPGGVYDTETQWCISASVEEAAAPQETRCWKCSDGSKGACAGGDKFCYGERSECSKKGCRISGSTSKCDGAKKRNQC